MSDQPKRRQRASAGLPPAQSIDRLPPHSIEAEQAILGCILLDPSTVLPIAMDSLRSSADFYDLRHQVIYEKMVEVYEAGAPINLVTLGERLKNANQLEPVGGHPYLAALPDATPSAANLEYYVAILEEKAALRRMITACTLAISRIYEESERAVDDLISEAERDVMAVRRQRKERNHTAKELVHAALEDIDRMHNSNGEIAGIGTGLRDIDRKTDGMHAGEMIVLAAFPGSGKTALAMNIAEHLVIDQKIPVGIFSLEMSAKRLMLRLLSSRARVNLRNIRDGFLSDKDFPKIVGAAGKLGSAPLHFCEESDINISQLRSKARLMVQQYGVRMIVVDYLQLISGNTNKKDQSREQEVSGISRGIKQMAGELNVPVLALSQLNEDGKLRESRAIGQDADSVWILKPDEKNDPTDSTARVTLEIRKQRDGEAPALIPLLFLKSITRFELPAKIDDSDAQQGLPYRDQ